MAESDVSVLESVAKEFANKHGLECSKAYRPLWEELDEDGELIAGSVDHDAYKYLRLVEFKADSKTSTDPRLPWIVATLSIDIRENIPRELIHQRCVGALLDMEECEREVAERDGTPYEPRWIDGAGKYVSRESA